MAKADKRARKRQNQQMARVEREAEQKRSQRKRLVKQGVIVAVCVVGVVFAVSRFRGDDTSTKPKSATSVVPPTTVPLPTLAPPAVGPVATIETNYGVIKVKLDSKKSPIATQHFVDLVKQGFYDGLSWHRVVRDFMIQGGDAKGDGTGVPKSTVIGEVPTDHYPVGSLAGAKLGTDKPGTFGEQIFIVTGSQGATLPNDYARWGSVVTGLDVAKKIEALAPPAGGADEKPTKPAKIVKVTIEGQ